MIPLQFKSPDFWYLQGDKPKPLEFTNEIAAQAHYNNQLMEYRSAIDAMPKVKVVNPEVMHPYFKKIDGIWNVMLLRGNEPVVEGEIYMFDGEVKVRKELLYLAKWQPLDDSFSVNDELEFERTNRLRTVAVLSLKKPEQKTEEGSGMRFDVDGKPYKIPVEPIDEEIKEQELLAIEIIDAWGRMTPEFSGDYHSFVAGYQVSREVSKLMNQAKDDRIKELEAEIQRLTQIVRFREDQTEEIKDRNNDF